jgi:hypothetical protein
MNIRALEKICLQGFFNAQQRAMALASLSYYSEKQESPKAISRYTMGSFEP